MSLAVDPSLARPDACQLAPAQIVRRRFARAGPRTWLRVGAAATRALVRVNGRAVGEHLGAWTAFEFDISDFVHAGDDNELEIECVDVRHPTNGFLPVMGGRWCGARQVEIRAEPTPPSVPAPQRSAADGQRLLVDGRPFRARGILHWGLYPELGCPWPTDEHIRREIRGLQALGFNLVKFCLWIPPPRYYALCQELGLLCWQEYPLWDTPLTRDLLPHYRAFFEQDRQYPAIILRTLTCENYRVDPAAAAGIIDLARELIPGCLILDNSAWLSAERVGDFHDEHAYLHNAEWRYFARRFRGKLRKPLLLGEFQSINDTPQGSATALAVRRYQIETLARDLPDAGYVITSIRDHADSGARGVFAANGARKYAAEDWAWQREPLGPPREIPELSGEVIGPRKGCWKCPTHHWWSPTIRVHDPSLPRELIERECVFELLSGRVLSHADGTRVLVDVVDAHFGPPRVHSLVIEFETQGRRQVVSAFRTDTPAGSELARILAARGGPAPEIGPLRGSAIVLREWEMSLDGAAWTPVLCDTPLVNRGANMYEGWATFRTRIEYPGGRRTLRCEAVGDAYDILLNGEPFASAGLREATWDSVRDHPQQFLLDLPAGSVDIAFHVRDWRGGGGMVGPVFLATDLGERVF